VKKRLKMLSLELRTSHLLERVCLTKVMHDVSSHYLNRVVRSVCDKEVTANR